MQLYDGKRLPKNSRKKGPHVHAMLHYIMPPDREHMREGKPTGFLHCPQGDFIRGKTSSGRNTGSISISRYSPALCRASKMAQKVTLVTGGSPSVVFNTFTKFLFLFLLYCQPVSHSHNACKQWRLLSCCSLLYAYISNCLKKTKKMRTNFPSWLYTFT